MGGPKSTAQRPDGKGARKDGRSSSTMKPEQFAQGERARLSGKPVNLKVDVEDLEQASAHAISTSPIEKHMVNARTPKSARRNSSGSFLQPDQFIAELKVKTGNRSELSGNDSPGSARSTRSIRCSNEPRIEAMALESSSPHLRKSPKPQVSNGIESVRNGTQPVSHGRQGAAKRETKSRSIEISDQQAPSEKRLESFYEPAHSVPTLILSYEGKPAPAPAHLRARTGTGIGPSLDNGVFGEPRGAVDPRSSTPELLKSSSRGSGRSFKGASPALLKLQATSALLGRSCSPANMREKLVRSVSAEKESASREGDSRTAHSFHARTSATSHSQAIHSQPLQSQPFKSSHEQSVNDVEGNAVKPVGRLLRMLHWGASTTGLEVLKSLERKLGKKSSKVSSGSKNAKIGGAKDGSKAEQPIESETEAEREIREVNDRAEELDPDILYDDGNCSPRSEASSVSTTYSDVSSKSYSYKQSHHKENVKSEVVKSKLWLLRVHQKLQGRPSKESDDDGIYEAGRGAAFHGTADTTFKDVEKKTSPGSARFSLEKNAISKLVAKHKRNSTWDAGKLSPTDHLFSPKQPRLPKSDAHVLLAPPKKLTGDTGQTEFQRRRGKPSTLNTQSGSTASTTLEGTEKSISPRTVSAPVAPGQQAVTPAGDSRPSSQITASASTRHRQTQQGVARPALPSSGTFLQTAALILTSSEGAEWHRSARSSVQNPVSPARSESQTPPVSPGNLPAASRSSCGCYKGFNSPLPLPVRVGSQSSPSSPIYPASQSPGRSAMSPTGDEMQSTPASPRLYAPEH